MKQNLTLLFNDDKESRKACQLILNRQIPCEFLATKDENSPVLLCGSQEIRGLEKIAEHIESLSRI